MTECTINLKANVGDIIYSYLSPYGILGYEVVDVFISQDGIKYHLVLYAYGEVADEIIVDEKDFGERVFDTLYEAKWKYVKEFTV